jgi:Glycosyltransferases involved in cell wall biogenesis
MTTSVALCTFNGEKFLRQQIDSILNQSMKVDEIVVCDDRSKDATIDILNGYQKKYPSVFKIYQNESNLGSVKNFERAVSLCSNEIIFLSDQDDFWIRK